MAKSKWKSFTQRRRGSAEDAECRKELNAFSSANSALPLRLCVKRFDPFPKFQATSNPPSTEIAANFNPFFGSQLLS